MVTGVIAISIAPWYEMQRHEYENKPQGVVFKMPCGAHKGRAEQKPKTFRLIERFLVLCVHFKHYTL